MCGLIGAFNKKDNVISDIIEQYQDQKTRGSNGFGIIAINQNSFEILRATDDTKTLIDLRLMQKTKAILFHHRMPTSTPNKMGQTHPIKVSHDELKHDWYIMHNGVISNDDELKKIHEEELGYVYTTKMYAKWELQDGGRSVFNDSETFAIELARHLEGISGEIGTHGAAAFLALSVDKKTQKPLNIMWGTNGKNPLDSKNTHDTLLIASDIVGGNIIIKNTIHTLAVADIFNPRKKDINHCIKTSTIAFTPEPIAKHQMGFSTDRFFNSTHKQEIVSVDRNYDAEMNNYNTNYGVYDPLEDAFDRMCDRVCDDISEDLLVFFSNLATEDTTDEELNNLVDIIKHYLVKARERATQTREYYAQKEFSLESNNETLAADVDNFNKIS